MSVFAALLCTYVVEKSQLKHENTYLHCTVLENVCEHMKSIDIVKNQEPAVCHGAFTSKPCNYAHAVMHCPSETSHNLQIT